MRYVKALIVVTALFALVACGGSVSLDGNWSGNLQNGNPISLNVTQSTPSVAANLSIAGVTALPLTGTYTGNLLSQYF